ncbi:MAG: von Willebrand factor type A domain-containing protein [Bacteroidetes bacterium]|nr:von Willebrand factor type A domain-containing protein [Bacteroidota bacterium]
MKQSILSWLMLSFPLFAFRPAQDILISGKIIDAANGTPVAGATITIKGTKKSTISLADGSFSIKVPNEKTVLEVSAVGYEKNQLKVKITNAPLVVRLRASVNKLEEVVVTGYGIARKDDMVEYSAPALRSSGYYAPQQLMGRVAGVSIQSRDKAKQADGYADTFNRNNNNFNTEEYDNIVENRFLTVMNNPLSTFSIDVDGASYSNVRRFLQMGQMPPPGAVRIEEFINYFHYDYPQPQNDDPFSINTEISSCPWNTKHRLVTIGLQGKKIPVENLQESNLVFLIDVSGSMLEPDKLPLVQSSMKLLVDQLREKDKVAIVVYAGNAGLVLPSTPGSEKQKIKDAIDALEAGGSTAGGAGIELAYKIAKQNFVNDGNNRVILCTDGDFNVGPSSASDLEQLIEEKRKTGVFLTVLGYGKGNYSDSRMQKLANIGNGNHSYIDNYNEARKVLVSEFGGTLFTIAKDVKLQVEFNPSRVQSYRLIGYENRLLNKEDFNNDLKDAGDLGSGHTVTALYEIIPVGVKNDFEEKVDSLKYQRPTKLTSNASSPEIMTIKFRYKKPDADVSKLIEHPVIDENIDINKTSLNFRFAAAVAEFGMLLRNSEFKQQSTYDNAWRLAKGGLGKDKEGFRNEFLKLLQNAESITKTGTIDEDDDVSRE